MLLLFLKKNVQKYLSMSLEQFLRPIIGYKRDSKMQAILNQ